MNQDISAQMAILSALLDNEDFAIYFREKVNIVFTGINPGDKNLWEIPEVRKYIQKLDDEFPYWLYFLSKEGDGLNLIYECRMIPFLNPEDEFDLNFAEFKDSVQNRWIPPISRVSAVNTSLTNQFIFDSFFNIKMARPMPMYSVPGAIDHF